MATRPSPPPPARVLGAPVLVLALLTGCGPADTAAPGAGSTPGTSGVAASATAAAPTPARPSSPALPPDDAAWDASGPSSGVDRAAWPGTVEGANALLASLPEELGGKPLELGDPRDHAAPSADYGTFGTVFVQSEEDPELQEGPDRLTAYQLLQAGFGLGAICAQGSHRGTAGVPAQREGEQEGALAEAPPGVQDGSTQAWFSCRPITEDDEWGQAVGWTSGTTAWQVFARDQEAARTLITALHDAAR